MSSVKRFPFSLIYISFMLAAAYSPYWNLTEDSDLLMWLWIIVGVLGIVSFILRREK